MEIVKCRLKCYFYKMQQALLKLVLFRFYYML